MPVVYAKRRPLRKRAKPECTTGTALRSTPTSTCPGNQGADRRGGEFELLLAACITRPPDVGNEWADFELRYDSSPAGGRTFAADPPGTALIRPSVPETRATRRRVLSKNRAWVHDRHGVPIHLNCDLPRTQGRRYPRWPSHGTDEDTLIITPPGAQTRPLSGVLLAGQLPATVRSPLTLCPHVGGGLVSPRLTSRSHDTHDPRRAM